jgi:hypothetical protein
VRGACNFVEKDAVIRLENEVGIGPADIDAYARHGWPDMDRLIVLAPPCQSRMHNALVIPTLRETLSAMARARNP